MQYFSKLIRLFALFIVFIATPVLALGALQNIDGFPLMPNFTEVEEASLFFDKPEGRVIEGLIAGSSRISDAVSFYEESLAHIGWVKITTPEPQANILRFIKEGEALTLELSEQDGKTNIQIFLVPSGAP